MSACQHAWAREMSGGIMSAEAWNNSMARTAVCMSCKAKLHGYEAAQAIKAQRDRIATALAKDKIAASRMESGQ